VDGGSLVSQAIPRHGHSGGYPLVQLHLSETGVSISNRNRMMTDQVSASRDATAAGPCRRLSIREPQEIPLVVRQDLTGVTFATQKAALDK
jgi:hypothetical protein